MSCKLNSIIKSFNRILVIGDLHADFHMTKKLFKHFNIINNNNKWIAKNTYIVQLGDQLDGKGRGHDDAFGEHEVLEFLDDLNTQAECNGGAVYSLIGNHELMNVLGDFRYASDKDIEKDNGHHNRKIKYSPGGILAKRLACSRHTILKIDDILFVHGGISKHLSKNGMNNDEIKLINTTTKDFFLNKIDSNNHHVKKYLLNSNGLLWDRSMGKQECDCDDFSYLECGHIIVGHTPQKKINNKCNNKIWRTDVGLSKAMGSNTNQILEITKDRHGKNEFKILN